MTDGEVIAAITTIWFVGWVGILLCQFDEVNGPMIETRRGFVMALFWPVVVLMYAVKWACQGIVYATKNIVLGTIEFMTDFFRNLRN